MRLLASLAAVASGHLVAQAPRLAEAHLVLPTSTSLSNAIASGDVNGDGLVDHVFCPAGVVWSGIPGGGFVRIAGAFTPTPSTSSEAPCAVLTDLDGDGDLDACVPRFHAIGGSGASQFVFGGQVAVYTNDGTGRFTETASLGSGFPGEKTCGIAAGDVDGDGDVDVVTAVEPVVVGMSIGYWSPTYSWWTVGGQNRLWLNTGGGAFVDATSQLPVVNDFARHVKLADFDGDGDLDAFLANHTYSFSGNYGSFNSGPQSHKLYRNQGNGVFVVAWSAPAGTQALALHVHDFDQDGDVDVLLHDTPQALYLVNQGNGTFVSSAPPLASTPARASVVADFDADGRLDYAVHTLDGWLRTVRNLGASFAPDPSGDLFVGDAPLQQLFVGDFEDDGDPDLFAAADASTRSRLWRNAGSQPWQLVTADVREEQLDTHAMAVGDVDGDGHPDLLVAPSLLPIPLLPGTPTGGRYYRNDGHGGLALASSGAFASSATQAIDLDVGDLDGDGDLDALARANPPRLYRNVGGQFTDTPLTLPPGSAFALGDLDGDGDLDLFASNLLQGYPSPDDAVWKNNGNATFVVDPAALPPSTQTSRVQLVDLDNDGDLDALACSPTTFALRNDGSGTFTQWNGTGLPASASHAVLAADFDGDADIDVVIAPTLHRNNGSGFFTAVPSGLSFPYPTPVFTGDVDGDGDLDVVGQPGSVSGADTLWLNGGTGFFTVQPNGIESLGALRAGAMVDLDGDGDDDVVATAGGVPRIFRNRHRQLTWRTLPRVGRPLILDIEARANDPYALAIAFAPARIPIPGLGVLRLDPASLVLIASGTLDAAGKATFWAAVPATPGLAGLTVYWQALNGAQGHLGNLEQTTLLGL
jgi:hypothetical protein